MRLINIGLLFLILQINLSCVKQKPVNVNFQWDQIPVTSTHFNDDTNKLQFAIVSDLWGGYRSGVFEDAVDKLELLQPQFVMSVGDLIDGATNDSVLLDKQWTEFTDLVNTLTMPFFYVPGNHDIANAWMEKEWNRRFSQSYYYFTYKNVLFLCLNTQDKGHSSIGEEQIDYFRKAIEKNPDVRWIFVFMHRPVWQGENNEEEGYERIEEVLIGKNYTVFSGHHHTYSGTIKNGNKHFVLGSTGAGSDLRGVKFGEFDHITLVTLNKMGPPEILNLKLDGMIKDDGSGEDISHRSEYKIITSTPRE
jgi:3',5'-cyclic AMP phosphodiesterase CpdA